MEKKCSKRKKFSPEQKNFRFVHKKQTSKPKQALRLKKKHQK